MSNIKKVELTSKTILGIKSRTNNRDEMNPKTQKIAPLWEQFYTEIMPNFKEKTSLFGVYYNYESDVDGMFDVLVGSEEGFEGMVPVTLDEGKYLKFQVKGEMPQAIIEAWTQVWAYFDDPSIDERRAYGTDFEHYISMNEAEIYIGVHYF